MLRLNFSHSPRFAIMSVLQKLKAWLNNAPTTTDTALPEDSPPALPEEKGTHLVSPSISENDTSTQPENATELPNIETITLRNETEFCGLMLEKAILAHQTWLHNLESALRGENPSIYKTKMASDDRLSELGMWLYKNENIFAPYSEYAILLEINKRFHECAGEVVEHHRQGRFADAILLLRRDLSLLSEEVQKSLLRLHEQVQEKGEKICE